MDKPLYYWLPNWAIKSVLDKCCDKCKTSYNKQDITAIAIKPVKNKYRFCVEQMCSKCSRRSLTVFGKSEHTLEGMCYFLLEQINRKKIMAKAKHLRKEKEGPITDTEAQAFIDFVQNAESYSEVLDELGIPTPKKSDENTS